MSSSIGPARAALYGLLTAASNGNGVLSDVQVTFGPPDQLEQQEVVAILGVRQPAETSINLGLQSGNRSEEYRIEVAVKSYNPAGTALSVETRCCAMYDAVRELIIANNPPTVAGGAFGVDKLAWALPTGQESDGPLRPQRADGSSGFEPGWVMRFDLQVECKARA